MSWYTNIQRVLSREPETWLAYNFGQNLESIPHLLRNKPRYRGVVLLSIGLLIWVLKNSHFRRQPTKGVDGPCRFLVFADTINQMNSLDPTIDALRNKGERVLAIAKGQLLDNPERKKRYLKYSFGLLEGIRGFTLLVMRGVTLGRSLRGMNPVAINWYFNRFCEPYFYLVFFYRLLKEKNPEFVITSNDHNSPNRCLLAVAHYLGIKTVYMQHATVGELFPALRVNYAFLDGESALDTYRKCERNQPPRSCNVPMPAVFLTGQKKKIIRRDVPSTFSIGFAVNILDSPLAAVEVVYKLVESGCDVRFRWHPGQSESDIHKYKKLFSGCDQVFLSDPRVESGSDYMERIRYLIAGNSSILLEGALAGICPIYFELQAPSIPDVYNYVKHGLAKHARSVDDLLVLIHTEQVKVNERAVRYYSATFQTDWEGREGELMADCLSKLAAGVVNDDIFGYTRFCNPR